MNKSMQRNDILMMKTVDAKHADGIQCKVHVFFTFGTYFRAYK